jgi:hypothetical protein
MFVLCSWCPLTGCKIDNDMIGIHQPRRVYLLAASEYACPISENVSQPEMGGASPYV